MIDLSNKKILITGANGHLGTNLIQLLAKENCELRLLIRPNAQLNISGSAKITVIRGEVTDLHDLTKACEDIDYVFHLACPTTLTKDLQEVIKKSTQHILAACCTNQIKKLIYVSSVVTIGFSSSEHEVLTEIDNRFVPASEYHVWKRWAEDQILQYAKTSSFEIVVTKPATIVGGFDYKTTPSSMPPLAGRKKAFRVWIDSGITVAPVCNVAMGLINALKFGKPANSYILGGENINIKNYFSLINELNNHPPPIIKLPNLAIYLAGFLFSILQFLGFSRVPFDLKRARSLVGMYGFYSSNKAVIELGYQVGTAREAVLDYYSWLSEKTKNSKTVLS